MYKRLERLGLTVVVGFFCIMLVFLFAARANAECVGGDICIDGLFTVPHLDDPAVAVDELQSGVAYFVKLTIDPTAPRFAAQYRLYSCCCEGLSCTPTCTNPEWGEGIVTLQRCDPNSSRFSYRLGNPKSGCPETYLWIAPYVSEEGSTCKLAAVLLDANVNPLVTLGHVIDKDVGEDFKIKP